MAMRSQKWLCDCAGGAKSLGSGPEIGPDPSYKSDSRAGLGYGTKLEMRD